MPPLHDAPPVVYPVGRSRFLGLALLLLWLTGVILALVAWWQAHLTGVRLLAAGAAVLLAGLQAGLFWHRLPRGLLRWDGAGWWLESVQVTAPALPGELGMHLDLQRHLLLAWRAPAQPAAGALWPARWRGHGRLHWLWADAGADPARWHELRCAVYSSRATTDAPDGAADP